MNQSYIIKQAILSEKTYKLMKAGTYTFLVAGGVTKRQIAASVEKQFGVKVARVNLAIKAPKTKRITGTRKTVKTQSGRKAIVYLAPGQNIEMFAPKTKKEKKELKNSQPKTQEVVEKKEKKGLLSKLTRQAKEKENAN